MEKNRYNNIDSVNRAIERMKSELSEKKAYMSRQNKVAFGEAMAFALDIFGLYKMLSSGLHPTSGGRMVFFALVLLLIFIGVDINNRVGNIKIARDDKKRIADALQELEKRRHMIQSQIDYVSKQSVKGE